MAAGRGRQHRRPGAPAGRCGRVRGRAQGRLRLEHLAADGRRTGPSGPRRPVALVGEPVRERTDGAVQPPPAGLRHRRRRSLAPVVAAGEHTGRPDADVKPRSGRHCPGPDRPRRLDPARPRSDPAGALAPGWRRRRPRRGAVALAPAVAHAGSWSSRAGAERADSPVVLPGYIDSLIHPGKMCLMIDREHASPAWLSCTAFDGTRRITSGPYLRVALSLKAYDHAHPGTSVLIFDDTTGKQIDFDLRGSDAEIAARLQKRFPAA